MSDAVPARSGAPTGLSPEDGSQAKPPATIAGHTPGPWKVETRTCIGGPAPCVVFDHGTIGGQIASLALCVNAEANALLIAAAPDMLADLDWYADQLCEGWCEQSPDCAHFEDCGGCRARRTAFRARGEK